MLVGGLFVVLQLCTCRTIMGTGPPPRTAQLNPLQASNLTLAVRARDRPPGRLLSPDAAGICTFLCSPIGRLSLWLHWIAATDY